MRPEKCSSHVDYDSCRSLVARRRGCRKDLGLGL
jgi:hypothetical protein